MPVIGFLHSQTSDLYVDELAGFRRGLKESGYVEGQNLAVEYRWGNNQDDQLPVLAADLVRRQVAAIVTAGGSLTAITAKAATSTIPIVFTNGGDPVKLGLVASLNRPGGNVTGISRITSDLAAKRLEILRELVPKATTLAYLIDSRTPAANNPTDDVRAAARALGRQVIFLEAGSPGDFEPAFTTLAKRQAGALIVGPSPLFTSTGNLLVSLAARYNIPAIYQFREFVSKGGLMSYGADLADTWRLGGLYAGRILNGTKPADLPVQLPTKFALVINLKTAKALGLEIPPALLARADEVIE
jgi:putative ABC transport system substrate-binding protein